MKVKMYSLPTCQYCNQAKAYFESNKIEFEEINVEGNEKAQKEAEEISGQKGMPVIVVDGKVIVGFDESKLAALVK